MNRVAMIIGYAWLGALALLGLLVALSELARILGHRSRDPERQGEVCEFRYRTLPARISEDQAMRFLHRRHLPRTITEREALALVRPNGSVGMLTPTGPHLVNDARPNAEEMAGACGDLVPDGVAPDSKT